MYKNFTLQRKRVMRKLGEVSFDLEVARNFMQEGDASVEEVWEEMVADVGNMIYELKLAETMAKDTLAAIKGDYGAPTPPTEKKEPTPVPTGPEVQPHVGAKPNFPKDQKKP